MKKEDWEKGLEAWQRMKQQAEIDQEMAQMCIESITKKIEELKEVEKNGE